MAIDYDKIKNWPFPEAEQTYTEKNSILYALGVGYGHDPMDETQLQFVYEKNLKAAPTMPVVLGYPGFWVKDPAKLTGLSLRFSAPVFPGETIRTEMWNRGGSFLFRSRVVERDVVVLNNGVATISP